MSNLVFHPASLPATIRISADDGRELLSIHADGTVTGELEDASEAARVFVETLRRQMSDSPKRSCHIVCGNGPDQWEPIGELRGGVR